MSKQTMMMMVVVMMIQMKDDTISTPTVLLSMKKRHSAVTHLKVYKLLKMSSILYEKVYITCPVTQQDIYCNVKR